MAEVVQNLHELQALPPETHWFCPCTSLDDYTRYYEEDLLEEDRTVDPAVEAERIRKIEEAQKRKHLVLDAFRILAYNGAEAAPYRDWLQLRLEHWMTTCHICIRVFHASRSLLRQRLEEQYDVEQVVEFMKTFDELNVTRITQGLKHAQAQLASLPESERKIANLGSVGIHSLFEVLSCEPYLRNPTLMAQHFDSPFQLVQTRKKLRLHSFLPALSYFFFSSVESRYSFAVFNWEKLWRSPTRQEFEWAIRRPLFEAMMRVQISSLDMSFVPRFWDGARLIVSKLNKDLVTHSLRGIDISIYRLALEHLQLDSPGFTDLLRTVRHLIELSPTDFWDAMGAIPPSAFIEQIFHSPALKKIFLRQGQEDAPDLGEIFGWILPFLTSIKPQNITPACRSMVHQLMTRNQDNGLPTKARVACFNIALLVLSHTLENLSKERTFATFVGTAVVSDMLDLVKDHVKAIVSITKNLKNPVDGGQPGLVALTVVERSIALDCLALSMRRESIHAGKPIRNTDGTGSEALWNALISAIDYGDQALATYILLGTRSLVGLERFTDNCAIMLPESWSVFRISIPLIWPVFSRPHILVSPSSPRLSHRTMRLANRQWKYSRS
ncbi:hypothetical protein EJ06DRAFT_196527 [Trichodelitschia bisporula]|uniref:Helicase Sen1 N-terminal domain-containing protein n=1 Tax=Trichodelitschia bisporula TaxID=703511 RepID=A0A6G1I8K1_9PEZI|nr:hypothetical protein EJ06DRAFT_196527 [Trichodelitschia bisporula]